MSFQPITTAAELDALDGDLMLAGYRAGLGFTEVNYTQKDQAYWHGYLNGQVDSGRMEPSEEQHALARNLRASGYFDNVRLFDGDH